MNLLMPITYKLVGIEMGSGIKNEMNHQGWDDEVTNIDINIVKSFFIKLGCPEDLSELKFITDSETMNIDKMYPISKDSTRVIFVFTMNLELKNKLKEIFNQHGFHIQKQESCVKPVQTQPESQVQKMDEELLKPIPEDQIKIDDETIMKSNEETVKLFNEVNFKTLLKIYVEDPNMFKRFASYISSGDVMISALMETDDSKDYSNELEEIKNLNIGVKEDIIKTALIKFNGHINLTLRYLLATQSVLS